MPFLGRQRPFLAFLSVEQAGFAGEAIGMGDAKRFNKLPWLLIRVKDSVAQRPTRTTRASDRWSARSSLGNAPAVSLGLSLLEAVVQREPSIIFAIRE